MGALQSRVLLQHVPLEALLGYLRSLGCFGEFGVSFSRAFRLFSESLQRGFLGELASPRGATSVLLGEWSLARGAQGLGATFKTLSITLGIPTWFQASKPCIIT